jgi:hypothetical protein
MAGPGCPGVVPDVPHRLSIMPRRRAHVEPGRPGGGPSGRFVPRSACPTGKRTAIAYPLAPRDRIPALVNEGHEPLLADRVLLRLGHWPAMRDGAVLGPR